MKPLFAFMLIFHWLGPGESRGMFSCFNQSCHPHERPRWNASLSPGGSASDSAPCQGPSIGSLLPIQETRCSPTEETILASAWTKSGRLAATRCKRSPSLLLLLSNKYVYISLFKPKLVLSVWQVGIRKKKRRKKAILFTQCHPIDVGGQKPEWMRMDSGKKVTKQGAWGAGLPWRLRVFEDKQWQWMPEFESHQVLRHLSNENNKLGCVNQIYIRREVWHLLNYQWKLTLVVKKNLKMCIHFKAKCQVPLKI